MTASVQNALSALENLESGLEELGHGRLKSLAGVVRKCIQSLAGQIEFYESAKAPMTSLIVEEDGQQTRHVTGMKMEALSISGSDHVIYGKPEAIAAVRKLLPKDSAQENTWEVYF